MKRQSKNYCIPFLLFAYFAQFCPVNAQNIPMVCNGFDSGALTCEEACVNCHFDYILGNNANGSSQNTYLFCPGIAIHNAVWYGFIAGSSSITFEVTTSDCIQGDGLQAALFADCGQPALACQQGAVGNGDIVFQIGYDQFIQGKHYFFMIDGYQGDVCNYEIRVINGNTNAQLIQAATPVNGPATVCPGASVEYHVDTIPYADYFQWTAPPGTSINGMGNNVLLPSKTANIFFGQSSGQVCVSGFSLCAPSGAPACKYVSVTPIPPTILPGVQIPFEDLPYIWPEYPLDTLDGIPGIYPLEKHYISWLGCDSVVKQQVIILPPGPGYVGGHIFWDNNDNGIQDPFEQPFSSSLVVTSSGGTFANSGLNGQFSLTNQAPGDTIRPVSNMPGIHFNPPFRLVQTNVFTGYDFGLNPVPSIFDLSVVIEVSPMRPGFHSVMTLHCRNEGLTMASGVEVTAQLPDGLNFLTADPPLTFSSGMDYTWVLGDLQPGETRNLTLSFITPVTVPIGTVKIFSAQIIPVDQDHYPGNNHYTTRLTVVGSFDPNDKTVEPVYVTPGMLANGTPFEYTIRFQNTGTFEADFVRIVDTLGPLVDPASFQFLASSHPCTWKIRGAGEVEFFFQDIHLPDSSSNEPGSHGFVKFRIKPRPNVALGTVIKNFCDIYFDFNAPVRTNSAGTQVVYFIPAEGLDIQDALRLRPNPATLFTDCFWKTPAPSDGLIRIFDAGGLPKMELQILAGDVSALANVSGLSPGFYYVVLNAGELYLINKLVVVNLNALRWN